MLSCTAYLRVYTYMHMHCDQNTRCGMDYSLLHMAVNVAGLDV